MTYGDPIPGDANRSQSQGADWPTLPAQQSQPQPPGYGGGYQPAYTRAPEPDWNALADRHQRDSKRGKWRLVGAVGGAFVLGAVAGGVGVHAMDGGTASAAASGKPSGSPSASVSTSASTSASASPSASAASAGALADADGDVSLSYQPGAQVRPGNGSKVLWLDGTPDAYAAAPAPVVNTDGSFTVSAWVIDKRADGAVMAISQGEGGYYAFALGRDYWPGHHGWVFKVQSAAGNSDNTSYPVYGKGDAALNTWVFLTGTYDAKSRTISLYVNGKLAQSSKVPGIWHNPGALQIGRAAYKGQFGNNWDGAIAHVQIWTAALTPAQVAAALHDKSGVKTAHSWLVS
ncbi:LamG domain-containing protein [Streptacidiphilus sp. MAP12-20]|uniref:LamG domain-containing protein n=1 Tax=Streptacidiphilus sp. MAP12-20 TaxID=3156299 RepID=UPI003511F5DA